MQKYQHIIIIGVIVLLVALFVWPLLKSEPTAEAPETVLTESEAIDLAMDWVESEAPTYVFDGSNLALESIEEIADCDNCYQVTVSFESSAAGYGDRSDQMLAQVITPHTMEITIEGGEVTLAETDGEFIEYEKEEVVEEDPEVEENGTTTPVDSVSETREIQVFFSNSEMDPEALQCDQVYPVNRSIDNVPAVATASISELLAGPTATEETAGYFTNINEGVNLQDISIEDGVAYVDFDETLQENVGGSCAVTAIRAQIEETVSQFSTVSEVVISIDGEVEEILQP